jgi:hypothetical protein
MKPFPELCRFLADKLNQAADDEHHGFCHYTVEEAREIRQALHDWELGVIDRTNGNVKE